MDDELKKKIIGYLRVEDDVKVVQSLVAEEGVIVFENRQVVAELGDRRRR